MSLITHWSLYENLTLWQIAYGRNYGDNEPLKESSLFKRGSHFGIRSKAHVIIVSNEIYTNSAKAKVVIGCVLIAVGFLILLSQLESGADNFLKAASVGILIGAGGLIGIGSVQWARYGQRLADDQTQPIKEISGRILLDYKLEAQKK